MSAHDQFFQTGFYVEDGGQTVHVGNPVPGPQGTGAAIVQGPGAGVPVNLEFTFAPAAGAANITNVTIQAQDGLGNAVAAVVNFDLWLSAAATGAGLGAAPSGTPSATTGVLLAVLTTKLAWRAQTDATGALVLQVTDTGKTLYFVCAANQLGVTKVSAQLVVGNYG